MIKCTHETSIILADYDGFSLLLCTWECKETLIQLDLGNHKVITYSYDDLISLHALAQSTTHELKGK